MKSIVIHRGKKKPTKRHLMKKIYFMLSLAAAMLSIINIMAQEVGTLSGALSVSPSGAATYSIPLDLPEGRNGMTPELAITYNSQSSNGLLGVGWGISGLSAISRTGQTIYYDNNTGGVNLDIDDCFTLDGSRLILIGSTGSWSDEYKTEVESYSKIIAYHNGNHYPEKFKVWTKSGLILEYGFTDDACVEPSEKTVPYIWYVNNIKDRLGNFIEFECY